MKRTALAVTLAVVAMLVFLVAVAYNGADNHLHQDALPTSTPNSNASSTPATGSTFDGLGVFGIISPANETYNSSTLTLSVGGYVIIGSNVYLTVTYNLDGKEKSPLPVAVQTRNGSMIGSINGSVTLPNLTDGKHNVTVFGDLEANGSHLSQETVHFTVQEAKP